MRFTLPKTSPESGASRVLRAALATRCHAVFFAWMVLCVLGFAGRLMAEPPPGHYDGVDDSGAAVLREDLHGLIRDHQRFPYTSTATDTWDILESADEDPEDASAIRDVYANASYPKFGGGGGGYEREHAWPKSYGFPDDGSDNYPYSDTHHLFLADGSYNGSRSNKLFGQCHAACTERPTVEAGGVGGGSGVYPGYSNWTETGLWETWIGRRGDLARALFYMDVRYEGGAHGITGHAEPDLVLTDDVNQVLETGVNAASGYMGRLSVLLAWHEEDPVDAIEMERNDVIASYQGNRNPFIDHPEWVSCVFEDECDGAPPLVPDVSPWINEIHYENAGADSQEGFEIAGPAGTSLSGWRILHYNGSDGGVTDSLDLSGSLGHDGSGYGFLFFSMAPLQNGPADGLALVDPESVVVEFLSWEGVVMANAGAASGSTSVDLGVAESSATPAHYSLQRIGIGSEGTDYVWGVAQAASPGLINPGQSVVVAVGVPIFSPAVATGLGGLWLITGFTALWSVRFRARR